MPTRIDPYLLLLTFQTPPKDIPTVPLNLAITMGWVRIMSMTDLKVGVEGLTLGFTMHTHRSRIQREDQWHLPLCLLLKAVISQAETLRGTMHHHHCPTGQTMVHTDYILYLTSLNTIVITSFP